MRGRCRSLTSGQYCSSKLSVKQGRESEDAIPLVEDTKPSKPEIVLRPAKVASEKTNMQHPLSVYRSQHPFVEPPAALIPRTPANPVLPSIFIISDSTADFHPDRDHEGAAAIQGWGDFFPAFFDPTKVNVVNAARGGRSTRTYMTEGLWDKVLAEMKPNDVVLIQLGQNDIFELNDKIARVTGDR
jgi:hypothetical protein